MTKIQDRPHLLELAYKAADRLLRPLLRRYRPGGWMERLMIGLEKASKGPLFGCRMCGQCVLHSTGMTCPMNCPKNLGQCVLHSTGMTCPMNCPKNLRNGPCGGVRPDGRCEVLPEMPCVWVQAWERSQKMPLYGPEILRVLPPLNRSLQGSSAWLNHYGGLDAPPSGWGSS